MVFPVLGGASSVTPPYDVSNSIRFDAGSSSYLSFTTSTPTSQKIATWSFWMKKAKDATQVIFGSSGDYMEIYNESDGELWFYMSDSNSDYLKSTALHRDQSAWYHIVMVLDTTQGTEANRAKMFVNGTQLTSFISANYPSQNDDLTGLAASKNFHIGARAYGGAATYLDAYIADFNFIDGTAYDPTYFGETNDNGVWIPKKPTGISYGNNGFFLEFKQTGTSANSSGMGADTSGNDNHFASNNLGSDHITTDTPTNNFCTMNPLGQGGGSMAEGNLKETTDDNAGCPATFAVANGKWYWEIKIEAGSNNHIGIADADFYDQLASSPNNYRITLYQPDGRVFNMGSTTQGGDSGRVYDQGDIMAIRLDLDSGTRTIKWYEDDTLIATENIGAAQVLLTPFAGKGGSSQTQNYNFGNPAFSISSGNSDANGYGNFEYAVPSGHYALCTKNLAEYG
jgi:hypothetical protein|tara:strand:+ start:31 stop:1392 length:1362 start_codon:yes stop_codon:yes gene_type:complete